MNIKKSTTAWGLGLALAALSFGAQAEEAEAYFDNATGKLIIPRVRVNGVIYFGTMSLINPDNMTFRVDLNTLTDITRPDELPDNVNLSADDILGTWTIEGMSADELYITFNADGSYEHYENTQDEECSPGHETGSYTWDIDSGLLIATVESDENGECGLSHPTDGVPLRILVLEGAESAFAYDKEEPDGIPFVKVDD